MKIFTNTDEIRKYASISKDTYFEDLEPKLNQAARKFVVPVIGNLLASTIETYYNAGDPDTSNTASHGLLKLLQEAVANIGLMLYVPEGNAQLGSSGLHQNANENTTSAPWWAVKDLLRSYAQAGEEALDEVVLYLEKKATDFADWTASDERTELHSFFVRTTAEFHAHHNIYNSRRTFQALKPIMEEVEDLYLEPQLTEAVMDELKALDPDTDVKKKALELVRKTVVNFTIVRACSTNLFSITSDGMRSRSIMTVNSFLERFTPAEEDQIRKTEKEKERTANAYLARLMKHLNEHASASVFPAFYNSEKFVDPADAADPSLTHNTKGFLGI